GGAILSLTGTSMPNESTNTAALTSPRLKPARSLLTPALLFALQTVNTFLFAMRGSTYGSRCCARKSRAGQRSGILCVCRVIFSNSISSQTTSTCTPSTYQPTWWTGFSLAAPVLGTGWYFFQADVLFIVRFLVP